ncbi:MAG: DNA alkylation repair protein [Lachnospiraceae bacterium]|nr:DNA alkylation repair protein [Lachnospiraceae bacterium]
MWYDALFEELEQLEDCVQAERMSAYMQHQFSFLGIPTPKRKAAVKPYLKQAPKEENDWGFVKECWKKDYREAQYVGMDYLLLRQKKLKKEDLNRIRELLTEKSWWDTVDILDGIAGVIVKRNPDLKEEMLTWSASDSIWLRRAAINFQLKYKGETDTALLEQIICNNLESREFFINKAIGWSLRDYGRIDPEWVRAFLEKYKDGLASLSKREAMKYVGSEK